MKKIIKNFSTLAEIKNSLTKAQIEYIQKTLYPSLKPQEIYLVLYRAKQLGLDVLQGELTSYSLKDSRGNRQLTMIVSKDAKMRLAKQTGELDGVKVEAIYRLKQENKYVRVAPWEGGELWGAMAKVFRKGKEYKVIVRLSEYNTHQSIWKIKPETMIKKVALSQALTMAFPELFAGIYEEGEISSSPIGGVEENASELHVQKGEEPATDQQKKMIKELGGELSDGMSRQEAAEKIKSLVQNKIIWKNKKV